MTSINDLPNEILLKIFRYYIETETLFNFMKVIYNVSLNWRYLCCDTSLWCTIDGSLPFETMMILCSKGCFRYTRNLKFSENTLLTDDDVNKLFSRLKNVKVIDFSNLKKLSSLMLSDLGSYCPEVCGINFGNINDDFNGRKRLNYNFLVPYLSLRGSNLLSINLSYCVVQNLTSVIRCIADCCPNLEELSLFCIHSTNAAVPFPTDYIQKKCQKLKILHLDHLIELAKKQHTTGFPNLEVLSFCHPFCDSTLDMQLNCILFNSSCLKTLDLTCCKITTMFLCSLPATDLQILHISKSEAINSNDLHEVMAKWSHSLKQVDISYSLSKFLDKAVLCLINSPSPQIKDLNLSFTKIKAHMVGKILQKCSKLQVLHLECCRNLGRGMKQVFVGVTALKFLEEKVNSFMHTESTENESNEDY